MLDIIGRQKGKVGMSAEAEEQQAIQDLIDKSDRALAQGNIDAMFAYMSPDYVEDNRGKTIGIDAVREMWIKGQQFTHTASTSQITAFALTGNTAIVFSTSHDLTRLKFPRWVARILIITEEQYRSEWAKTSEGWYCTTSAHLKTRFRRIKWQNPGEHLVSEPGQPAT